MTSGRSIGDRAFALDDRGWENNYSRGRTQVLRTDIMKDRASALQIRFFRTRRASCLFPLLSVFFFVGFSMLGCRGNTELAPREIKSPVIAASGTVEKVSPVEEVRPVALDPEKSLDSKSGEASDEAVPGRVQRSAYTFSDRYAYPRARRVSFLEGDSEEGLYRFVLVSEDGVQQVLRFYRKRFPLAPYQYGNESRIQYLFSQGAAENTVRVRIANLGAELDGLGGGAADKTVITLTTRATRLPAQDEGVGEAAKGEPGSDAPSVAHDALDAKLPGDAGSNEKGAAPDAHSEIP